METKHTPTPWIHLEGGDGHFSITGDGKEVAFTPPDYPFVHARANAAHIVRCVNSHDDLLAACQEASTRLQMCLKLCSLDSTKDDVRAHIEICRSAIAAATKESF